MSEYPELEAYRRGPKGDIDRFLGLWIELIVAGKQARTRGGMKRAGRTVSGFLGQKPVKAVLDAGAHDVIDEHLRDSARVYFETCQSDSQYSAVLFGTKRLSAEQVRAKAAAEAAGAIGLLGDSGVLEGVAARLPRLLVDGYLSAFDSDDAASLLRAAISRSDSASKVADLLW
ncbi:DUF6553 family protein [Tessaracoccus caeni]|uniref:DUF6553 family protein n=1 Tax=Tessaracoccus caeni TaxID=3031239 RepID=UPI0023DC9693|nr:DUF6553 family protein [Tessaracoccus caeni]MDF1489430.1 hypothetical protein [Tessaracoccus caeni]